MTKEKATAAANATTTTTEDIVANYTGRVKVSAYAKEKSLTFDEIAGALQNAGYEKCGKMAISVAARSSETAVQLVPDAFSIIYRAYGQPSAALIRHVRPKRTKPCRLYVYLTESEHAAFNAAKGALNTQEYLHALIVRALKGEANA